MSAWAHVKIMPSVHLVGPSLNSWHERMNSFIFKRLTITRMFTMLNKAFCLRRLLESVFDAGE